MYQGAKSLISRIFFSGVSGKYLESSSPIRLLLHLVGGSVSLVLEFIGNSKIYNKERKEGKKGLRKIWGSQDVTFTKCGCAVLLLPAGAILVTRYVFVSMYHVFYPYHRGT